MRVTKENFVLTEEEVEGIAKSSKQTPNPYFEMCKDKTLGIEEGRCGSCEFYNKCMRGEVLDEDLSLIERIRLTEQAVLAKCRGEMDALRKGIEEIERLLSSEGKNCVYAGCKRVAVYYDINGDRYCGIHKKQDEKECGYRFWKDKCLKERISLANAIRKKLRLLLEVKFGCHKCLGTGKEMKKEKAVLRGLGGRKWRCLK